MMLLYNFVTETSFRTGLVVKLSSGGSGGSYSIRLGGLSTAVGSVNLQILKYEFDRPELRLLILPLSGSLSTIWKV